MTQKNIKVAGYISIALFLFFQLFGIELSDALGYAVSLAALFDIAYDRYLWRYNPFESTPRLYGCYDAIFYSTFNGGTVHPSKIQIKQTLSTISVYEECSDGYSESVVASLVKQTREGMWHLYYTYRTHPNVDRNRQDDSHEGTALLCIRECGRIEGTYFTNRLDPTGGNLKLRKIS